MKKRSNHTARRLVSEKSTGMNALESELKALQHNVNRALADLAAGQRIDEHLIANAVMITALVAKWNLVRDLIPMVDEDARDA